jgi:hypothetical protein
MAESNLILRSETGEIIEIPPEGMLGLLALGAVGIKAWREKRQHAGLDSHWQIKPQPDNANTIEDFHTQGLHND